MANSYKRFVEELTATVAATVLTVPAATTAIVKSIWVANDGASSTDLTVTLSPAGAGTHSIVPSEAIASEKYVDILAGWNAGPLVLEAEDELIFTSTQDDVYVTVSALLVDRN